MVRKKILIITFTIPYPPNDGGKLSVFGTVNYLRNFFEITLVFKTYTEKDFSDIENLRQIWPNVNIQNVHYFIPSNVVAKKKIRRRAVDFLKLNYRNLYYKTPSSSEIIQQKAIDFYPFQPIDEFFLTALEGLFRNNFYDIIQVEYSKMLNLIHVLPTKAKKIFVQIENRYTILEDYFRKNDLKSLFSEYIISNATFSEFNLINKYDYVFALNGEDKKQLSRFITEDKILIAPFPILDSLHSKEKVEDFEPNKIVFLGSQEHPPNEDAVVWFIESMYDAVQLKLYVTGNWQESFKAKYPTVIFTGFLDDLSDLLRNSIVISPIRLGGGGVRAKVLQAMSMKCPLISTSLGCIGLEGMENKKNIFIADSASEFIAAINELHNEKQLCRSIIFSAYKLIEKYYSERAVGEIRRGIYNRILNEV